MIIKVNLISFVGGLGNYTPSKMSGTQYELGVSRSSNGNTKKAKEASQTKNVAKDKDSDELRPAEEGQSVSWSGSSVSSADMLF